MPINPLASCRYRFAFLCTLSTFIFLLPRGDKITRTRNYHLLRRAVRYYAPPLIYKIRRVRGALREKKLAHFYLSSDISFFLSFF